eukprot:CAMPEP_0175729104 /NCGR_PEP_ID=MMETSP0097-20121207/49635_1 /TAXON_ID=311494 /ORGANISM="Alexandrium monilatum, Strain CCMP3105" /LENGTH=254 /DNA_ID=CAMNT_0017036963 /DNA_START=16 /DNA_END=779 /DNA_ORIENTATION=-
MAPATGCSPRPARHGINDESWAERGSRRWRVAWGSLRFQPSIAPGLRASLQRGALCRGAAAAAASAVRGGDAEVPGQEDEPPEEPPKILGPPSGPDPGTSPGQAPAGVSGPVPVARVAPRKFKIMYTCKICDYRNSHMISRIAYNQGIVVATCPGCNSRHLLSDKTGLLDYGVWDVEMLARSGESVTRLGGDGYRRVTGAGKSEAGAPGPTTAPSADQLLVRNEDGLIEALPEGDVSISGAAEFLSGSAGTEEG